MSNHDLFKQVIEQFISVLDKLDDGDSQKGVPEVKTTKK